nr:dopamine D2-like receptor [Nerophis lumbriciformis]
MSEERIQTAFLVANCLILISTAVVGVAANAFVVLAVCKQKSLQTWTNALVVNLAAVDTLRCVCDCPILLAVLVLDSWPGASTYHGLCDVQVASFSFACCVQLSTLACISAERYLGVARPFQSSRRRLRIAMFISLTWLSAFGVAFLSLTYTKDSPVHMRCNSLAKTQTSSYDTFGIYILFPLWASCFGLIVGFYVGIFAVVRAHNRKIFDKGIFPVSNREKTEGKVEDRLNEPCTSQLQQSEAESPNGDSNSVPLAPTTSIREEKRLSENDPRIGLQSTVVLATQKADKAQSLEWSFMEAGAEPPNGYEGAAVKSSTTKPCELGSNHEAKKQSGQRETHDKAPCEVKVTSINVCASLHVTDPVGPIEKGLSVAVESPNIQGAVCMLPSNTSRERKSKKKESKMAKRAGYIILTFLVFWMPLVTTILINWIVHRNRNTQVICPPSVCLF